MSLRNSSTAGTLRIPSTHAQFKLHHCLLSNDVITQDAYHTAVGLVHLI